MLSSRKSLHIHKDRHTLICPHPSCPPFPGRSSMPPLAHLSPCTRDCPGDGRPCLPDLASSSPLSSLPISPIPAPRKDVYTHTLSPFSPNLLIPLPPCWISCPLSETPALWITPSLFSPPWFPWHHSFWRSRSISGVSFSCSLRFLPHPPFKCQHSLSLWPWLSALCTCTAFQLDLTLARTLVTIHRWQCSKISLNIFQSIKDMAEEVGKILHMLQKHFIIFKVINKSNPLLGWSTKPPTQQSQPESINYLPILRLLPSSGVQLFWDRNLGVTLPLHDCQLSTISFSQFHPLHILSLSIPINTPVQDLFLTPRNI